MKKLLTLLVCISLLNILQAQTKKAFWTDISETDIAVAKKEAIAHSLFQYRTFSIHSDQLKLYLNAAPKEGDPIAKSAAPVLEFPMPDGTVKAFAIYESPVLMPELSAKYPEIKSYKAIGLSDNLSFGMN